MNVQSQTNGVHQSSVHQQPPVGKMVLLSSLVPWKSNPPGRASQEAVASLMQGVQDTGHVEPITLLPDGKTIINGVRRHTALSNLGYTHIAAVIYDGPITNPQELWFILNKTTRKQDSFSSLYVYVTGGYSKVGISSRTWGDIQTCEKHFSRSGLNWMIQNDVRPSIGSKIEFLGMFLDNKCGGSRRLFDLLKWIVLSGQESNLHQFMGRGHQTKANANGILAAFKKNVSYTGW